MILYSMVTSSPVFIVPNMAVGGEMLKSVILMETDPVNDIF